jgi:hypothetical protein
MVDGVQSKFSKSIGLSIAEARLPETKLLPLSVRRDVAILGIIHKSRLTGSPIGQYLQNPLPPLRSMRRPRHQMYIEPLTTAHDLTVFRRSILCRGVSLYNNLPANAVTGDVKHMQTVATKFQVDMIDNNM